MSVTTAGDLGGPLWSAANACRLKGGLLELHLGVCLITLPKPTKPSFFVVDSNDRVTVSHPEKSFPSRVG